MAGGEIKIAELRGWSAVVVLVAVVAFGAWRTQAARRSLDTDAREQVEMWLKARYARMALAEVGEGTPTEEQVQRILASGRVEIVSLEARGTAGDMVVKAEATVDGEPPPDGEPVTYWRMTHSALTGWTVESSTSVLGWWLAWL